jgi:hypothetical protein
MLAEAVSMEREKYERRIASLQKQVQSKVGDADCISSAYYQIEECEEEMVRMREKHDSHIRQLQVLSLIVLYHLTCRLASSPRLRGFRSC